jgi:hypothetical protein
VLLAALVSFCAAQSNEIGNNKELLGYPKNAAVNWDKFMVRETYFFLKLLQLIFICAANAINGKKYQI